MTSLLPLHNIKQILCFLRVLGFLLPFLSEPSLFHVSVALSCSAFILLPAFPPQGGILSWKQMLEDGFWKSTEAKLHPFSYYPWTLKKKNSFNWRIIALQYCVAAAKSFQSCLTLCDPTDGSPPGSSVPGILQAKTLEWAAISFSSAFMRAKSLQSCPTPCDPIDGSPRGSSVPGILQAKALECVAISFSNA